LANVLAALSYRESLVSGGEHMRHGWRAGNVN